MMPDSAQKAADGLTATSPAESVSVSLPKEPQRSVATAVLSLFVPLAIILVSAKAYAWGRPSTNTWAAWRAIFSDVVVLTQSDLLFLVCSAILSAGVLLALRRRPRLGEAVWTALLLFCVICAGYAIVSIVVWGSLHQFLTYSLICMGGDFNAMKSSLSAYVGPRWLTLFVAFPLAYAGVALLFRRFRLLGPPKTLKTFLALLTVGLILQAAHVQATYGGVWKWRFEHRLMESPHWVLLRSLLVEATGGSSLHIDGAVPAEYLADFQTVEERGAATRPTTLPSLPAPQRPKNVILYVLESVGAQHLGLWGGQYPTTPNLEREAANALVFDNCYAHVGMTASSMVALTLSTYPGLSWRQYTFDRPDIPGVSLPQLLQPRGYRTAFMSSSDMSWALMDRFVSRRGFDETSDYKRLGQTTKLFSWGVEDRHLVDGILQWTQQEPDRPFFLMAWTTQTHHPYALPEGYKQVDFFNGKKPYHWDINRYLNVLQEMDHQVGRLLEGLRRQGRDRDTVVIFTGDHGEAFGWPHQSFFHGQFIYQEDVRVPLMIWSPVLYPQGRHVQKLVSHVDVVPTIADLLGLPAAAPWQGWSVLDPGHPERVYFFSAQHDFLVGLREGQWKYTYNATTTDDLLYDLSSDPMELQNRAAEHPELCQRYRLHVAAWVKYQRQHLATLTN